MNAIDRLTILDACVDGDIDKLHQLIGEVSPHFNVFFNLCKSSIHPKNIDECSYDGYDNKTATFNVLCPYITEEIKAVLSDKGLDKKITINQHERNLSINIQINNP